MVEVRLDRRWDDLYTALPAPIRGNILVDIGDVEQQVITAHLLHLEFNEVHSKRRTILEHDLALPVVRAFILVNCHVTEAAAPCVQFGEIHPRKGGIGNVFCSSLSSVDCSNLLGCEASRNRKSPLSSGCQCSDGPGQFSTAEFVLVTVLHTHLAWYRSVDDHIGQINRPDILDLDFKRNPLRVGTAYGGQTALLSAVRLGIDSLTQNHHSRSGDRVFARVFITRF